MRTTLNIDDSALDAAKQLAQQRQQSVGEVVSELINTALKSPHIQEGRTRRNGLPLFPVRKGAGRATMELVKELMEKDEDGHF